MSNAPAGFKLKEGHFRRLTPGEIELARRLYKNSIDYSSVRITHVTTLPDGNGIGKKATSFPWMEIYFRDDAYSDDFSKMGNAAFFFNSLHIFIHEMCHMWQFSYGFEKSPWAIALQSRPAYDYSPKKTEKLSDFNSEQQCEIMADYFAKRYYGFSSTAQAFDRSAAPIGDYGSILKDFLRNPKNKDYLPSDRKGNWMKAMN
jgi:type VI secretion system secreted protein VgrG